MAFDPSAIQDISAGALSADPAGAQAKALTLADLYNTNTLNKIKVGEAQQEQSDMTYARQLLKGKDLSKLEDQDAAVAEITKRSPKLGMQLAASFSKAQSDKASNTMDQYGLMKAKNDILGGDLAGLKARHDQIQKENPNATEQQIHDAMQGDVQSWVQRVSQQKLPNGQPLLNNDDRKTILDGLGRGYSVAWVNQMVERSAQGAQQLKAREVAVKESDEARKVKADEEKARHDKATEAVQKAKNAGFSDRESELLGSLADASVSLPAGLRSQAQQKATLQALLTKHSDLTTDEIAQGIKSGKLKLTAETSGARTAGTQIGKVSLAANELDTFGDQVLEASKNLPRGQSTTINGLIQMAESQVSDPKLLRLRVKLQALNNAYDQLAARGGTDADKRAHIASLFNQKLSDEGIRELVKSVKEEAEGARAAANRTIAETSGSAIPGAGPQAKTAPGITPPADAAGGAWGKATVVNP